MNFNTMIQYTEWSNIQTRQTMVIWANAAEPRILNKKQSFVGTIAAPEGGTQTRSVKEI